MQDYPYSVFKRFSKAVSEDETRKFRALMSVIRVAASDNSKRFENMWKELGDGK